MKSKNNKIILTVVVILIIAIGAYFFFKSDNASTIALETTAVKKGNVTTTVTSTGTVEPLTEVEVGTQVSGEVKKIYVDFNSQVKKGELLAELDKTNLKATVSKAQASYDNAVNDRDYYKKIYDRQKQLFDSEVISQADYDEAYYNYVKARSSVTQLYSDLQEAKTNLSYADIYSPIDGIVLSRDVDEGQTVAANFETPTLFTIAKDLKEMQVEADVDEADIGNVEVGQRVEFTVDAYQGETFTGTVTQVRLDPDSGDSDSSSSSSEVVTYTVVIKADNPDLKLKPGLTATVVIYTLEKKNVLTTEAKVLNFQPDLTLLNAYEEQEEVNNTIREVPKAADTKHHIVWVNDHGKISSKDIEIGATDGVNVEILKGVNEGEQLLFNVKQITKAEANTAEGGSPFMPKFPKRDKKK
ncbi:efflux RND transporter periplasmic adaptor subunit [Zhouia sp. PK063]|uniref:efflux RND transporter periplasmic adaptor subunit n=1 Tax=Zhouia sp. PK063 TaxID=3373602 RepID=UPI0037986FCD